VFLSTVLTARAEPEELLYDYDVVARLAEAQLVGVLGTASDPAREVAIRDRLAEKNFVRPGILWWAFAWGRAEAQANVCLRSGGGSAIALCPFRVGEGDPAKGVVVLIDEVDKADSSVPNGLLEALGSRRFAVPICGTEVEMKEPHPLVIVKPYLFFGQSD
jgi:MoxR-like ATPase